METRVVEALEITCDCGMIYLVDTPLTEKEIQEEILIHNLFNNADKKPHE